MPHRHAWRRKSQSAKMIWFGCDCGAKKSRPSSPRERQRFLAEHQELMAECDRQNRVCREFDRTFKNSVIRRVRIGGKVISGREYTGWKYTGYDLMSRVERWAKKYPKDVYISGIDDTHFASSDLVFILHRPSPRRIWGTTCVVITQLDGVPPKEFFMYPGHRQGIQEALARMAQYRSRY